MYSYDEGYQAEYEYDEREEQQRATTLVAEAYSAANEPGEYTDEEEIDDNGVSSHLQYEDYTLTALNTSHGCKMGCPAKHMLVNCPVWLPMSAEDKKTKVFALKLCTNCFSSGHMSRDCPKRGACDKCPNPHHRSLHDAFKNSRPPRPKGSGGPQGNRGPPNRPPPPRRAFEHRSQGRSGPRPPPPPGRRD